MNAKELRGEVDSAKGNLDKAVRLLLAADDQGEPSLLRDSLAFFANAHDSIWKLEEEVLTRMQAPDEGE